MPLGKLTILAMILCSLPNEMANRFVHHCFVVDWRSRLALDCRIAMNWFACT